MLNGVVLSVLESRGKITLPSLGTFIKMDIDQESSYLFTPVGSKADPFLISTIEKNMAIDNEEAIAIIESYVLFIKSSIDKNGKYHFKGVGNMVKDSNGVLVLNTIIDTIDKVETLDKSTSIAVNSVIDDNVNSVDIQEELTEQQLEVKAAEIIEDKKAFEDIQSTTNNYESVKELNKLSDNKTERLNEKFTTRRLAEIMEDNSTTRFADTLHKKDRNNDNELINNSSDNISITATEPTILDNIDPVVESATEPMYEPILENIPQIDVKQQSDNDSIKVQKSTHEENNEPKRKTSLSDIYGGNHKSKASSISRVIEQSINSDKPNNDTSVPLSTKKATESSYVASKNILTSEEDIEVKPKKKTDWVMIICISIIIIGLGIGAYYWLMQRAMEQLN